MIQIIIWKRLHRFNLMREAKLLLKVTQKTAIRIDKTQEITNVDYAERKR